MKRIDHVQIAIPAGGEDIARAFYVEVVGLTEVDRPPALQARGGAWFALDDIELHLGVDPDFTPAGKAHPGLAWDGLESLADRIVAAGYEVKWDAGTVESRRRFHTLDPFGNRLEFLEEA